MFIIQCKVHYISAWPRCSWTNTVYLKFWSRCTGVRGYRKRDDSESSGVAKVEQDTDEEEDRKW